VEHYSCQVGLTVHLLVWPTELPANARFHLLLEAGAT